MSGEKILIVEDDRTTAKVIELQLAKMGYVVVSVANSASEAIRKTETLAPDLLLMDIKLGKGMDGIETAELIMARYQVPVVYLTAYADSEILERAKSTRPLGYVNKPLRETDLRTTITFALEQIRNLDVATNEDRQELWRIQTCYHIDDGIDKPNPATDEQLRKAGYSDISELLPEANISHVTECLHTKKSRLITGKIGNKAFSWEYSPSDRDNTVRITITDISANWKLNLKNFQQTVLLETLDHLATGIIFVNENLNIFYTNRAADKLLESDTGLFNNDGYLNCREPETTANLQKMVLDNDDHVLSINDCQTNQPLHIVITPLEQQRQNYGHDKPTNILFAFHSLNETQQLEDVIRSLYSLSPTEARITARLMQTPNLDEVAKSLNITYNTARTHLKRIFHKTKTNRLSTLIHMVATGPVGIVLQMDKYKQ